MQDANIANSQASVRPGRLRRLFALLLLVATLWGCVILYWLVRQSMPNAQQLVLGLGVIPGSVILLWFAADMLKGLLDDKQRQQVLQQQQIELLPEQTDDSSLPAAPGRLAILSAFCCLPAGLHSGAPLPSSLSEIPYPALHPDLRDAGGLPLRAAWVELENEMNNGRELNDGEARTLALLERVMEELVPRLHGLARRTQDHADAQVVAGLRRIESATAAPRIRVWIYLAEAATQRLEKQILEQIEEKLNEWGLLGMVAAIELVHQATANQLWQTLESLSCGQADFMPVEVLMAAESQIAEWLRNDKAYEQMRQGANEEEHVVPGEGAAGVIFLRGEERDEDLYPSANVLGPVCTQVDRQAMTSAKITKTAELIRRIIQDGGGLVDDSSLAAIHDGSMGSMLTVEALQALATNLPGLDPAKQVLALAIHVGKLGPVAPLAQIALATTQMYYTPNPIILLSLDENGSRFAMALHAIDEMAAARRSVQATQTAQ